MKIIDELNVSKKIILNELVSRLQKNKNDKNLSFIVNDLKKEFHYLFDQIDWELKQDYELNSDINDAVELKEIINFNIVDYFYSLDENNRKYFDLDKKNQAVHFVESWIETRTELKKKIKYYQNIKHMGFIFNKTIEKLNFKVKSGDYKYNQYKAIFNLEKRHELLKSDRSTQIVLNNLENDIKSKIDQTMTKHINIVFKDSPEIILFKRLIDKDFVITSSAFLSNKHNSNLSHYFDSKLLKNKLDSILDEYIKEQESLENDNKKEF